jgi:hypothetical protein
VNVLSKLAVGVIMAAPLFCATGAKSQTTPAHAFVLSLGVDAGLPTGTASHLTAFTLGGDIRLQYGVNKNLAATFTTGGYHFFPKNAEDGSYGIGPIKVGVKWFFTPNLYLGAEAGVGVEVLERGYSGGHEKLLLSPAFGYANKHWDLGVRYESYSGQHNEYGQVALRLAYGFRLTKRTE